HLLVPKSAIMPYLTKITMGKLGDLKRYWGVSMQALIRHAFNLNMITKNQFKYYMIQMGRLGYRKREPLTVWAESPALFKEILNMFITELGYSKDELARLMMITLEELNKEYFQDDRLSISHLRIAR